MDNQGHTSVNQQLKMYIYQFYTDTEHHQEDLAGAMTIRYG